MPKKSSARRKSALACFIIISAAFTACAAPDPALEQALARLSATRAAFFKGDFELAEDILMPLTASLTPTSPLIECELASIALLAGDSAAAKARLGKAMNMLENFFDTETERKAASVWGADSGKVWKGDPYERAMLYTFYGMLFLEAGEADTALASFKRAMLMDADTENQEYQSDFPLPQFLAAKSCDILGDSEQRDMFLRLAFDSLLARIGKDEFIGRLVESAADDSEAKPRFGELAMASWAGEEWLAAELSTAGLGDEQAKSLAAAFPKDKALGFNALLVKWEGQGPKMFQAGKHNEKRMILTWGGETGALFEGKAANAPIALDDFSDLLGDITFQATTRGGREMDNILRGNAQTKSVLEKAGTLSIIGGYLMNIFGALGGDKIVQLSGCLFMAGGAVVRVAGGTMNAEADIRCWQCLPDKLVLSPLALPQGETALEIARMLDGAPISSVVRNVAIDEIPSVRFIHIGAYGD